MSAIRPSLRARGLSPRVRGNLQGSSVLVTCKGSIPACAGEPTQECKSIRLSWVYPRVCGGTAKLRLMCAIHTGLSPRVRGNPRPGAQVAGIIGSIPACAGEPRTSISTITDRRVYPRVCGGTGGNPNVRSRSRGLSPRVRGNLTV